ncbi:MAG TPA: hypothetical protein VMU81_18255 [Acetobacteraceae bacterium]|nr:hypothetical protein [Acetobacteraceae bacterium]
MMVVAPAQAAPIATLEAIVGAATQSVNIPINAAAGANLVLSGFGASAGNGGYTTDLNGVAFNFGALGGVASANGSSTIIIPEISTAPAPLTLEMTETGLTSPAAIYDFLPQFSVLFHSDPNMVTFSAYFDPSDSAFGTADQVFTGTTTGHPPYPFSFSDGTNKDYAVATPFSITWVVTLTPALSPGSTLHPDLAADEDVRPAPEPRSLAVLGSGLIGLVVLARRQRRRR